MFKFYESSPRAVGGHFETSLYLVYENKTPMRRKSRIQPASLEEFSSGKRARRSSFVVTGVMGLSLYLSCLTD